MMTRVAMIVTLEDVHERDSDDQRWSSFILFRKMVKKKKKKKKTEKAMEKERNDYRKVMMR